MGYKVLALAKISRKLQKKTHVMVMRKPKQQQIIMKLMKYR